MKGFGISECLGAIDCEIWEGMEGRVVWCGVDEKVEADERKDVHFSLPQGYGRA